MTNKEPIKAQDFGKYMLELDARGFLWIRHKSHVHFELEDAVRQVGEIASFCETLPIPFLIDVRVHNWDAPKEVREFHAKSERLIQMKSCEAILVNNLGLKIMANFYSKINRPSNPTKVFTSEEAAINWVLDHI